MPITIVNPDTFDYYFFVQELVNGSFNGFDILPPGIILFYYLLEFFISKTIHITIIQNFISLFSCFFLIYAISLFNKKTTIYAAIAIAIYMMDSYSLLYDFALLTESLYRNTLIITSALLIIILNSKKKTYWLLFSISLILPPLFRSNGLYIYFLLLLMGFFIFINKYAKSYYLYLFIPIITLNFIWSIFNYSYEKRFFPGNPKRLSSRVEKIYVDTQNSANNNFLNKKITLFYKFTDFITKTRPQFYYTLLPDTYKRFYISDIIHKPYFRNDGTIPIDTDLRKFVYKEFYVEKNKYEKVVSDFNVKTSKNFWLKLFHFYYKFHSFVFNSYFILLLFFISYFFSAWKYVKSRFSNNTAFLIFTIGNIHFLAILSLSIFGWYQSRYIYVSEFIVYLTIALSPILFSKNIADAPK